MKISSAKDLKVYNEAYELAMEIFELSHLPVIHGGNLAERREILSYGSSQAIITISVQ